VTTRDRTAWQGSTPPSLIQQRMDIDRVRTRGLVGMWFGTVAFAVWLALLVRSGYDVLYVPQVVLSALIIGMGVWESRKHKRRLAAFEAEHGTDAGKQDPIR
jgi:hypothetical protein